MCSLLQCSSTCAGGFQRRVVVCQDADGRSNSYCDERVKPAESKSCDSGPCPLWNYGVWGEVRLHLVMKTHVLAIPNIYFSHTLTHTHYHYYFIFNQHYLTALMCATLSAPSPAVEEGGLAWWFVKGPTARGWTTTTATSWTSRPTWSNAVCSPAQALPPGTADHGSRYDSTNSFSSNTYFPHWRHIIVSRLGVYWNAFRPVSF